MVVRSFRSNGADRSDTQNIRERAGRRSLKRDETRVPTREDSFAEDRERTRVTTVADRFATRDSIAVHPVKPCK